MKRKVAAVLFTIGMEWLAMRMVDKKTIKEWRAAQRGWDVFP